MKLIGQIRDEMTPKIDEGGVAFTLRSRDYKGMIVVIYELSGSDRSIDGEWLSEIRHSRSAE